MALNVENSIAQTYAYFYKFSLGNPKTPPALPCVTLENSDDAAFALALQNADKSAKTVIIKGCKKLKSLEFIADFTQVSAVCIDKCPKITTLWDLSQTPLLTMLALVDCPGLNDITALQNAPQLEHFMLNSKGFFMAKLNTLEPLKKLRNIITMDLSCTRPRFSCEIPYNSAFPRLASLTITPMIMKYFVKGTPK